MNFIKDDIVISGIGGFFPKATNVEELKTRLLNNEDLLESRWKYGERGVSNKIGKIEISCFDNAYFGIHRQQSFFMDPMQRLVLEGTFEALIDAGVNPHSIKGKRIGVYMGSSIGENDNLFLESVISGFGITGHSRAMMSNRISYWLNLKGPSVAYDSNWVGGIEVIRLAYDAIRTGQCEAAIVGTANLALNCEMQWIFDDMGLLSSDGSTRAFDANATGYARSDGIVVLYLQKASEAKRSYANIVNVDTRFSAARTGDLLTANSECLTEFLSDFYKKSPIKPEEVEFVEAYGCGLKETDKTELDALDKIYCKNRTNPLLVGSIKTNTGHSEASASLFGVVKLLIAMETGIIPANIQYDQPNPEIPSLVDGRIQVVAKNRQWNALYGAVNAIGLDSYYGHILLKSNAKKIVEITDDIPRLVLVSTRTEEGIKSILETVKAKPRNNPEYFRLIHDLFSTPILGHLYRGYAVLGKDEEKLESEYHLGSKRQIWFVYSGMGSQWAGMISDLMKFSVFEAAIKKCAQVLMKKDIDLLGIISDTDPHIYDNILHSFIGIAALQIGLTDLLHSIGIVPDGIIGHSVGELGCAYADGCLTAEQMILAAYSRGRASLEVELIKGMMAAVGLGYNQIKNKLPPTIEVACHNGPDSSTISGPTEDMEKFVKELQAEGVFARLVNVSNIAYHSRYIKPAAPLLLKYLKEVIPTSVVRSSKWISTSNLEENWNSNVAKTSSPEYHTNNLLSSVYFEEGLKHIPKDSILIEIAPHGLLQAILKRSLKPGCTNIPITQRGCKSGVEFLLGSLGKMYLAGMDLKISSLYSDVEFPVGRGTASLSDLVHWNHTDKWRTGLEGKLIHNLFGFKDIHVTLNSEEFRECVGNQFDDKVIFPISFCLNIVYNIHLATHGAQKRIVFEDIYVRDVLTIPKIGSVPLHVMVQKGSGQFEVVSNNDVLMTGKITFPLPTDKCMIELEDIETSEDNLHLSGSDFYNELYHRGYKYSGQFKTVQNLVITEDGSVSTIQWNSKWHVFLEAMIQQKLLEAGERNQEGRMAKHINKIAISQDLLPAEKTEVKVSHYYYTNIIATDGIQIAGIKMSSLQKEKKSNLFDSFDFVPLNNISYNNIENGINTAIQLTIDNFNDLYVTNIMITEIESKNPALVDNVKKVLNQFTKLNPNVVSVKDPKQVMAQDAYPFLLIYNDVVEPEVIKLLVSCRGFLLTRTNKDILSYPQIIQVAQFYVDDISYSILRKIQTTVPSLVIVKGDTLSTKDLKRGSISWMTELTSAAAVAKPKNQSVYLISSLVPTEGFTNFMHELRSVPDMSNVRVLFTLDRKSSDFDPNQPVYQMIFKQDLNLLIIKEGVVGCYIPIPLNLKENVPNNLQVPNNLVRNKTINYIGVNLKDETVGVKTLKKEELGNIDYSGLNSSGQKIMGLAYMDKDSCELIPDPILCWDVPECINLAEAASIPHAYSCAYYALMIKGELKSGETVLIHAGCSPISLAAIAIAQSYNCRIYTTVSTDQQKAFLKVVYPLLNDSCILNTHTFAPYLLAATSGNGAHVIINCLSGNLLQTSMTCLDNYGRFIQIGKYDMEEKNSIGMGIFMKNAAFLYVDFENIFSLPNDVKTELKEYIDFGLKKFIVESISSSLVEHQNVHDILSSLKKDSNIGKIVMKVNNNVSWNNFNVTKPNQFICDAKSSYLVYGGSAEYWTDVVEWLVLRGAKKIVISSDSKPQQNHINRRLSLLQSNYGAEIVLAPNKAHTREGSAELLSEVYFLGPIHGVFLLPNKGTVARTSEVKPVHYIDQALRTTAPKALFVNFIKAAAGICYLRSEAGFCTYNVQWLKELEFVEAINGLDDILSHNVKNILMKTDKVSGFKQESAQALFKKLTLMLPSSIDVINREIREAPNEPKLIQLTTLGPREMRELIPLFILPGLTGQAQLEELARGLLYPTFCAILPATHSSIQQLAADYVQKIRAIWPKGPYNLMGISWGGALAMEIARILNKDNAVTHMYFLDGAPNTLQSALKHLEEDQTNIDVNLLTRIFNICDMEIIKKMRLSTSWESRVNLAIDSYKNTFADRKLLEVGLLALKKRLSDLSAYQPNEDLISGKIYLIRPSDSSKHDNCGLTTYCKTTPQIHLVQSDHLGILTSKDTVKYINETFNLI